MSNNFSQLLDLAIKQGHSRSSLMAEIKQSIIADYREKNPTAAIGIAVLIDEESGLIKIFAGDKDLGSEKFSQEASQLAQKILIDKIAQGQNNTGLQTNNQISTTTKKIKNFGTGILGKIIFWAYNVYFIFFNFSMALSLVIGQNFFEIIKSLEWGQALTFLGIFFLPIATVIFVIRNGLQKNSASLTKLFFLLELPLAILLLFSSSLIGQTTIFTGLSLLGLLAVPLILYIHFSKVELSALAKQIFGFFSQLSTTLLGYYALLFSFFLPLILIGVPKEFLSDFFYYGSPFIDFINYPAMFVRLTFALILFILILTLTALPYILLRTLWKIAENNRLNLIKSLGEKKAEKNIAISWIIVLILFAISLFRWPDHRLLTQLSEFDQEADYLTQETAANPLIEQEEKLQKLVERKLQARHYYLFDKDETFLADAYEIVFESEIFAETIQTTFTNLAYPLVYWEERTDQRVLGDNFQYLFGYSYYQSKSDLEDIDIRFKEPEEEDKNVLVTYREITVDTEADGLLARVTIEEEYENQTNQEQEIIYEFNLPDEVAFYDLKLGPNLEFSGVIAPKGAAQKVYERELAQRRDPALLEQTGPNQYRLRIFPVPGRNDFNTLQGQRQKVSFCYSVAQSAGAFALPRYTRESNVYSDASSSISLSYNGQISYLEETTEQIAATDEDVRDLCLNQEQNYGLSEASRNANIIFHANDADLQNLACAEMTELLPLLKDSRLAIVYDSSFNNEEDQTLHQFAKLISQTDLNWLNEAEIDLYKFNQVISTGERITGDNFKKLLEPIHFSRVNDFSKLGEITENYDLIVLVTSQDIDFSQLKNFPFSKPTMAYWVSEDKLPALNMEMSSGLWQTGGGTSTTIEEAIRSFLIKETLASKYAENAINLNRKLSLQFSGLSTIPANNVFSADSALAMISNKALLQEFVSQQNKEVVGDINVLDQLDQAARQANLISPYSSSIALVNQQQIETLKRLMEQYNRFQDTQMIENQSQTPIFWDITRPMPMIDDFSMEMMPSSPMSVNDVIGGEMMMQKSLPGNGLLSVDTLDMTDTAIAGQSRSTVGFGSIGAGPSIISNLASGTSFIVGTGLIAIIGLAVFLLQQLKKKKK